jgi:hypothetical protein
MAPKYTGHHTTKRERDDALSCERDRFDAQQQIKLLEGKCEELEGLLLEESKHKEDGEVSYRVGEEELTNAGMVTITVQLTSVENMFLFRDKLTTQKGWKHKGLNIRRKDSFDDEVEPSRQFVLRREVDEPLRVKCLTTTETEG